MIIPVNMISLAEIVTWLDDLWKITLDINISINNAKRISNWQYKNEEKIKNSGFFQHMYFQQKFILAIQLCKILDDKFNQKRNINKLIKRLESEDYDVRLIEKILSNPFIENQNKEKFLAEIKDIKESIKGKENLIIKISKVRDENYAHFDPNRQNTGPTLSEYQEASEFASDVYNRISFQINGSKTMFNHTESWSIDHVIKILIENYNAWQKKLEELK
jgi:hypothetical protein